LDSARWRERAAENGTGIDKIALFSGENPPGG
jgi:hypothetical protein